MTVKASELIAIARAEIGTVESPYGSNNVKYNTEYYGQEVYDGLWGTAFPWCCSFVWWCFRKAGASELFYGGDRTAGCTTLMEYHKRAGNFITSDYRPGDLALFTWSNDPSTAEHIGIIETVTPSGVITIEGNTSVTSNDNGGKVMARERKYSVMIGAIRPAYADESADEDEAAEEEKDSMTVNELVSIAGTGNVHSEWADEAVKALTDAGIFTGDGEGNYGWQMPITREAAAKVIFETLKKLGLLEKLR